ncbi:MAG: hypothetical protein IJN50_07035 [Clostridia bacterium]|nr:hypothetical protein [Clostridia bacterium]
MGDFDNFSGKAKEAGKKLGEFFKDALMAMFSKAKLIKFLKKYGIIFVLAGIALIFILASNSINGNTAKAAGKSAETIASSTKIENGEIKIDETVSETIREDLKEQGFSPESYYLGENDFCEDGSGLTYLDKMVQAEIVSNYPDTGTGDIRGIIKIHRNGTPLTYVNYTDFESKVSNANSNQNESDVNELNNLFTVDESWNLYVAVSNQTTVTDTTGATTTTYNVTTTPINYQMLVSQYTIPYEFLFVLMQITNNPEYVSAVADLALKGEIVLDIKDITTTETITESYEWTEETVVRKTTNYATKEELTNAEWASETKTTENKVESSTTVNTMTTIDVKVTKVDTWAYKKDTTYTQNTTAHDPMDESTEIEEELGEEIVTTKQSGTDYYKEGKAVNKINQKLKYTGNTNTTEWIIGSSNEEINVNGFLGLWRNKDGKYVSPYSSEYTEGINDYVTEDDGGKEVKYKSPEDKSYKIPIRYIINEYESADTFFYYLSLNERTQKIETLMRYMLYKYTGNDYGVTDEDLASLLSVFQEGEFYSIDGSFVGDSLEAKIWFALKGHGYSDEQVAGVIGNLSAESELNPNAIETSTGEGRGIAQWSGERRDKLELYADRKEVSWTDENIQIELLISEIKGVGQPVTEVGAQIEFSESPYSYNGKVYPADSWHKATTVEEAAIAFCVTWERPDINEAHMDRRIKKAEEIYSKYHGKTFGGTTETTGESFTTVFTSGITGKTFKMVNQNKVPGWSDKCNRAASMCIVSAYTGKTIDQLISEINSYSGGIPYGSNGEKYFNQYGLTSSRQNTNNHVSALSAQLRSGGYALIHLKGNSGFIGESGTSWTKKIHWVSIIGYKNENGQEKIYVADPASSSRCDWYDIDEFENSKKGFVNYLYFVREK